MDPLDLLGLLMGVGMLVAMVVALGVGAVLRGGKTYDQFGAACARCGNDVDLVGAGYACSVCGLDSQDSHSPAVAEQLRRIQQLSIAVSTLESAATEFERSKSTTSGSGTDSRKQGPFPERYLEGLEQVQEARQIAIDMDLELVLQKLSEIPVFDRVDEIDRLWEQAAGIAAEASALFAGVRKDARDERPG